MHLASEPVWTPMYGVAGSCLETQWCVKARNYHHASFNYHCSVINTGLYSGFVVINCVIARLPTCWVTTWRWRVGDNAVINRSVCCQAAGCTRAATRAAIADNNNDTDVVRVSVLTISWFVYSLIISALCPDGRRQQSTNIRETLVLSAMACKQTSWVLLSCARWAVVASHLLLQARSLFAASFSLTVLTFVFACNCWMLQRFCSSDPL